MNWFQVDTKRFKFYIWIGLAYLSLYLFAVAVSYPIDQFITRGGNYVWNTIYLTVLNFAFFEYALPAFRLTWQRVMIIAGVIVAFLLLLSFGLYAWRSLGIWLHIYTALRDFKSVNQTVAYHTPYGMGSVCFFGIIRHIYKYLQLKQSTQQLRIEKQQAELSYLKSQTNPHFLFNTLNNIYSLARDKSDLAPESIMRLSKILRFMLYETTGNHISIAQEIKVIDDYIALESLRYDQTLTVNFSHDVENMGQSIQPLLLIPLVENAFKHGASETRGRPFVDIHLSITGRRLEFVVKNSADLTGDETYVKENIGLSNLRRQLQLLYTDYQLSILPQNETFTATLKINLGSHV